ncbi:hypothetical protein WICMUC_001299 [Wickerhamomyces mucosus]|uniref:Uncharacterized protein n=1 Tax=Wickerhamomyces mucosus TaxID=1378264 RepID=A0A9P8PWP7_9ASCO|nr:hypothetical protein WICMUC_001299 [Wickerhamomyces mucosus]
MHSALPIVTNDQRTIQAIPFGSQLDEVENALFEHRYKKQNNHFGINTVNNSSINMKFNANNIVNVKNGKNNYYNKQSNRYSHHYTGNGNSINNNNYNIMGNYYADSGVIANHSLNQSKVHGQQPYYYHHPKQQQQSYQQQYNPLTVNDIQDNTFVSSGFRNGFSKSPENFFEEFPSNSRFDNLPINLSSSVSSGSESNSSISTSGEVDYISNNNFSASNSSGFFNNNTNNNTNNNNNNSNSDNRTSVNFNGFNGFNGFNDKKATNFNEDNFNEIKLNNIRSDQSFGFLNIWGNDMSVWA